MAKLYFYFSAMNAGKSTMLLQSSYNYNERGMDTLLFTPQIDNRARAGVIASRIGLEANGFAFDSRFDFYTHVKQELERNKKIRCVLVDEAQFLTKAQVYSLTDIADFLHIPVLAYGLRTDFQGEVFEGSRYLLAWAEIIEEIKTICACGAKATMNIRIDEHGNAVIEGSQIEIGGNDRYISMCRKHYKDMQNKARAANAITSTEHSNER